MLVDLYTFKPKYEDSEKNLRKITFQETDSDKRIST